MTFLHFSVFGKQEDRHGGVKRSDQVIEVLTRLGVYSVNPYLGSRESLKVAIRNPWIFCESFFYSLLLFAFKGVSIKGFVKFSLISVNLIKLLKNTDFDILYLETAPGVPVLFMSYLKYKKIPYIVFPHNIEYLVPKKNYKEFRSKKYLYDIEITGYLNAELVYPICDFDSAVLRSSGVKAETFPYYPTVDDLNFFNLIAKNRREMKSFTHFLLLGTVNNPPTYNGMKTILNKISGCGLGIELKVAGYGTEKLRQFQSENIHVLGSVNDEMLEELLVKSKAILINQPQTSGFLTKIIEMNLCGIPQVVLSDYYQAKGLEGYGVYSANIESIHSVDFDYEFRRFRDQSIKLYN